MKSGFISLAEWLPGSGHRLEDRQGDEGPYFAVTLCVADQFVNSTFVWYFPDSGSLKDRYVAYAPAAAKHEASTFPSTSRLFPRAATLFSPARSRALH